jgi:crossover junction endodeoxyribonuclease RuvC
MIILGIDPGTRITGYGLIESHGQKTQHIDNGNIVTPSQAAMPERLAYIFAHIEQLILAHHPEVLALEKAFIAKNAASALKLGQCRGLVMVAAERARIPTHEYNATSVKSALCGNGRADKQQIQKMVALLLELPEVAAEDASDALALALCHAQHVPLTRYQEISQAGATR